MRALSDRRPREAELRAHALHPSHMKIVGVLTAVAASALIASTAWAVIPDGSGTIHACFAPDGVLRVIDTDAGQACKKNERPLDWAAAPSGELPDAFVSLMRSGRGVPATNTLTEIATLN